ncbi:MAG: Flagellar biosynthesis protein FlhA [Luteibacter sp.]|uniref:flagellar biosynthesis protein FlhA n=1 Tax=Luteibacter sp. TaxID=1886636 RepID=UPI00137D54A5|nr:flagellar biosynthesis protein FlhA [Luteibacter sp.]KAF1004687.1 MAG: Flagellar biosynthesis protein FlhA [Luteibacter sp.]
MRAILDTMRKQSDLALVFAVLGILLILFTRIPPVVLDLLIIVNFAFGLTILLLTFYVERPVDFSTFPSLLLIATLFRLSLNIAATRLIMTGADAGQVIGAIGEFTVRGNFVIGLIVFFILVVVQYVVVTAGAQRVSEVAARFVLDAMPGQQMSIDADLNMGLIDQDEAKRRRKGLEKEAGFYGSMDGASKFVKGDAIAGIIILLIDILGGWAIGVAQMGMSWRDAMHTFTMLTIGDGIVTQIPALIISVATGIIVTRSASDSQLGGEVGRQLVRFPKILWMVTAALIGLLLLPGMPRWPILPLAVAAGAGLWFARSRQRGDVAGSDADETPGEEKAADELAPPPPIEVLFGASLSQAWSPMQDILAERVSTFRKQQKTEMGFIVPPVVFRDGAGMPPNEYRVLLYGDRYAQAVLEPSKTLAIRASDNVRRLPEPEIRDPAFGLPAVWVENEQAAAARAAGYTPVDALTVLVTHVTEVIKGHSAQLLSRPAVVGLLDGVRTRQPGLVEELVPAVLTMSDVQAVLQGLLDEHVSIRNIDLIIETLADAGRHEKDPGRLGEAVRQKLGHTICRQLVGDRDTLPVLTLDPNLEAAILRNIQGADGTGGFVIDPRIAEAFLGRLLAQMDAMMRKNLSPVLLCRAEIRRSLRTFTRRTAPRLAVLAMTEVPHTITLSSFATVAVEAPSPQASPSTVPPTTQRSTAHG